MSNDRMSAAPRPGLPGVWDQFAGPGADPVENGLIVATLIGGPGLAVAWARAFGVDWAWWQWMVLALLTSELFGGMAANSLVAAKRWHHRAGQGPVTHFTYAALHIHPILLSLTAPQSLALRTAFLIYGLLLLGCGLILSAPVRLRGALSILYSALAMAFCSTWLPVDSPLGWLPAVLFLKVIIGYLVPPAEVTREEPRLRSSGPWS